VTLSQCEVAWVKGKHNAAKGAGRYVDRPTWAPYFEATRGRGLSERDGRKLRQTQECMITFHPS